MTKPKPWQARSIKVAPNQSENASKQRAALKVLTECELECGKTVEQLIAEQRAMKAACLKRLGLA